MKLPLFMAAIAASLLVTAATPAEARPSARGVSAPCMGALMPLDRMECFTAMAGSGKSLKTHRRASKAKKTRLAAKPALKPMPKAAPKAAAVQPAPDWDAAQGFPLIVEARSYLGRGPSIVQRENLWCAAFMNMVLKRAGFRGSGSNQAVSFASYGPKVSGPRVGAIAVMHGLGPTGHVGLVTRIARNGNPVIISGNFNNRVAEVEFTRSTVYAYVMPQPSVAMISTPASLPVYEGEDDPVAKDVKPAKITGEFDRALILAAADAKGYLIQTATPGGTMSRQGVDQAIGNLKPIFALRLAAAVKAARMSGLPDAGCGSAFRPPAFGVGGFANKYESTHTYGLACDMRGIGRPNSAEAKKWHKIALAHGLHNPYFGTRAWWEWNHYQAVAIKVMPTRGALRATVDARGPKDREKMWAAADPLLGAASQRDIAAWQVRQVGALQDGGAL